MLRSLRNLLLLIFLGAVLCLGAGWWWLQQPLQTASGEPVLVEVPPGAGAQRVAERVAQGGVQVPAWLLGAWFRLSGQARDIKAGTYEFAPGITPQGMLGKLARGEQALFSVQIIEGWTFRQALQALRGNAELTQDVQGLSERDIMALIGYPGRHPEGRFFPDTYRVARKATVSSVLRQAAQAMDERLAKAWAQRDPATPLRSADEALVLASIVEKETGLESDRAQIAGVFSNRLRIGMRLQTDPSVIYGLGERFDGNLRRVHLDTDGPYNTYTRVGLPPTPIALPGEASLRAAVKPQSTRALYFVARGDGSSHFSATLDEHNGAVRRYILGR